MTDIMLADALHPAVVLAQDAVNQLPTAAVLAVWAAPILVSMASRQWVAIFASSACCLASAAAASSNNPLMATGGLLSGYLAACAIAAWGLQRQRQAAELDNIHVLLAHMRQETHAFLHALDRRSMISDRTMLDAGEVLPVSISANPQHEGADSTHDGAAR